jgi:hypothetical protein
MTQNKYNKTDQQILTGGGPELQTINQQKNESSDSYKNRIYKILDLE